MLTDFGNDEAVYLIKSAIGFISPRTLIVDITHSVPACNILVGAWRFARVVTTPTEKEGTIYVGVVDPGVGGERKSIIVQTKSGKYLVGPDNGLLSIAFQNDGVEEAVSITNDDLTLLRIAKSSTFHGKDIYGPVAAHLANGVKISEFGDKLSSDQLCKILLETKASSTLRKGSLVDIDDFGTLRTNLPNHVNEDWIDSFVQLTIRALGHILFSGKVALRTKFEGSEKGELIALLASTGCIDIAANLGSASSDLKIGFNGIQLSGLIPTTEVIIEK
ncbi:MAG: SAM-dependent chlorinase/fluorinase [Candidatus Micrarchaeota archaeon]